MWLLILLGILVGLVVLLFVYVAVSQHISFYTKTTCSICGRETGVKGNCRYKLEDGFMCQSCAEKFIVNKNNLCHAGPNAFISDTVEYIRVRTECRKVMGEETWQKWVSELEQGGIPAKYKIRLQAGGSQGEILKKSYKGIGGGLIEIDGDDVTLKFAFIKETCKLGDIISIRFKEPMPLQWGCIEVLTKKQQSACYSIFFKKKALKEYEELYLFLLEHSSADKNEPDMLINIVQPDNKKHIPPTTPVCCPKCGSTQISANKKGFGVGKAVVGAAVAGPIGLTVGNIGSNKVIVTCLKCGHRWQAGKG